MADFPLWTSLEKNQILDLSEIILCLQDEININVELILIHEYTWISAIKEYQ